MNSQTVKFRTLNSSYLLYSKRETDFIYELNFDNKSFNQEKIIDLIKCNPEAIKFDSIKGQIFKNNLIFIDSSLPELLSYLLLYGFINNCSSIKLLSEKITELNPLNIQSIELVDIFYKYKIKQFLNHLSLGLKPDTVWNDDTDIYKNYPVIKYSSNLMYYGEDINLFKESVFNLAHLDLTNISKLSSLDKKTKLSLNLRVKIK